MTKRPMVFLPVPLVYITPMNIYMYPRSLKRPTAQETKIINAPNYLVLSAADQFKDKNPRVNKMWQRDSTYFIVKGWGWY